MIKQIFTYGFLLLFFWSHSQAETVVQEDFTIRDFQLTDSTLMYLKKRDVYLSQKEHYFIGGYGIKFFKLNNTVISAANELVRKVSSVRFYNIGAKEVEDIYLYKQGRIIDIVIIPEIEAFALSLTNKRIVVVNYSEKPRYYKIAEIELEALSRKIIYQNNAILCATDNGKIIEYNFGTNTTKEVYSSNHTITDFIVTGEDAFVIATLDGKLISINNGAERYSTELYNNFITTMYRSEDGNIVTGTWEGSVLVFDDANLVQLKSLEIHKKTVLSVKQINDLWFYSCGLDGTIKKWQITKEKK